MFRHFVEGKSERLRYALIYVHERAQGREAGKAVWVSAHECVSVCVRVHHQGAGGKHACMQADVLEIAGDLLGRWVGRLSLYPSMGPLTFAIVRF